MNDHNNMSGMDQDIPTNALRIYNQDDSADDFPVLKAFQQYIDAEQAKARKRMLTMGIFFGAFTFVIIAIFVALLVHVTMRNQVLNDRMLDWAMRDRENRSSAVVMQPSTAPQPQQDNSAMLSLAAKLDEMQKQMAENQVKSERAVAEAEAKARQAALEAVAPKPPSPEETEIARLRALLAAEKKNAEIEKERKRQAELEEYRRKHYPELYEDDDEEIKPRRRYAKSRRRSRQTSVDDIIDDIDNAIDNLDDDKAVSYFDEEDKAEKKPIKKASEPEKESSIPVDIKGSSSSWRVPGE